MSEAVTAHSRQGHRRVKIWLKDHVGEYPRWLNLKAKDGKSGHSDNRQTFRRRICRTSSLIARPGAEKREMSRMISRFWAGTTGCMVVPFTELGVPGGRVGVGCGEVETLSLELAEFEIHMSYPRGATVSRFVGVELRRKV